MNEITSNPRKPQCPRSGRWRRSQGMMVWADRRMGCLPGQMQPTPRNSKVQSEQIRQTKPMSLKSSVIMRNKPKHTGWNVEEWRWRSACPGWFAWVCVKKRKRMSVNGAQRGHIIRQWRVWIHSCLWSESGSATQCVKLVAVMWWTTKSELILTPPPITHHDTAP